ncbi:hypothetical protein GJU40_16395 [Bacillus lacus]|uniref:YkoS n=1 Tax=Metabacillus lacus TaxID=1983721 RepID=A0A7X2J236_9BACI|nr:DUF6044 family protein [Metabacillus lacus]MRX73722.1 hypothetical protein [Metabacillus lacus]
MKLRTLQNKELTYIGISTAILLLYVSPLFVLGEHAHIRVHDNLDSNLAWYKVLTESGQMLGKLDAVLPQIINGLPRHSLGTEWSLIVWLHALFPSMTAYAISQLIARLVAFTGMYLLLKKHVVRDSSAFLIIAGVSLAFALTPFWPSGMLSTLGHPLALWAFLNIRSGQYSWREWLTLALLPLYSSIVLGFFFFLAAVGGLWLYDCIKKRDANPVFLISILFMTGVFMLVEYRLVHSMLFSEEVSHRSEFISSRHGFARTIKLSFKNFVFGHTHVMTVHTAIILPLMLLSALVMLIKKEGKENKLFFFLLILNYVISFWYALWFNTIWIPLKEKFDLLNTFNFARFHFLKPLLFYVSFGIALHYLWKKKSFWRGIAAAAVLGQILILLPFQEEWLYGRHYQSPSFQEFFAKKQFQEINTFIGLPQDSYRVASIGLHPAVAQYNGFYTLDTYNNVYPLTYKYQFRKIIEKELQKNRKLRSYFDEWGSRCYIFVDELGKKYEYKKTSKKTIKHLQLNTEAFQEMGGRYFFSSVPILNAGENNLRLLKEFTHEDSAWRIYLYEAVQNE